jgi:hypothetical protein
MRIAGVDVLLLDELTETGSGIDLIKESQQM